MFDEIKALILAAQEARIGDALISAGNVSVKLGETYNALLRGEKFGDDDKQLELAEKKLAECCDDLAKQPKGAADPKAIDPATILVIVQGVLELLKAFREWRKKRQEG